MVAVALVAEQVRTPDDQLNNVFPAEGITVERNDDGTAYARDSVLLCSVAAERDDVALGVPQLDEAEDVLTNASTLSTLR